MATTIEDLEKRIVLLEDEVKQLRQYVEGPPADETPAERGLRTLRESRRQRKAMQDAWAKWMKEMGIEGEPIPAEELQAMMAAEGIDPEKNEFSRGIIEMREE
jgi:hypothetical protein